MNCKASWIVKKFYSKKDANNISRNPRSSLYGSFYYFYHGFFHLIILLLACRGEGGCGDWVFFFPFYLWRTEVTWNFLNYYQRTTFNDYEIWTNYHAVISEPSFNKKVRRSTFNETLRVRSAWIILYFSKKSLWLLNDIKRSLLWGFTYLHDSGTPGTYLGLW